MNDEEIRDLWKIEVEIIDKAKEYLQKLFGDNMSRLGIEKIGPKKRGRKTRCQNK
jgi:hypothetical protein